MDGIKRSNVVIISLIGAAGALVVGASAFPETQIRRNLYNDRAACERDYSTAQCEQTSSSGSSGAHGGSGGGWRGPVYVADHSAAPAGDPGPGRTGVHAAVQASTRGGFGGFGHSGHASS